ncbi:MAG: hypothetical protein ACK5PP_07295 [Acidimicrobiales bacterium]
MDAEKTRSNQPTESWSQILGLGWDQFVEHEGFGELMEISAKMTAAVRGEVERSIERWLHLFNLPAASDVRQLSEQVESLERHLQALRRAVDSQSRAVAATAAPRPTSRGTAAPAESATPSGRGSRSAAGAGHEPAGPRHSAAAANGARRVSRSRAAATARLRTEAGAPTSTDRSDNGRVMPGTEV